MAISMVRLRNGHIRKNPTKTVNPTDLAWNAEEEEAEEARADPSLKYTLHDAGTLTLSGLTCLRSLSFVICAVSKKPQPN